MFSVVILRVAVSKLIDIFVLNPGLSLIFMSVFLTPCSTSNSFATFLTNSRASSNVKSSG